MNNGWYGFDLDGTLAIYTKWRGATHIGEPVMPMLKKLIEHLDAGDEVRIFTARVSKENGEAEATAARLAIEQWCEKHVGTPLAVTNEKDMRMIRLYDDRCVHVETNTGRILG